MSSREIDESREFTSCSMFRLRVGEVEAFPLRIQIAFRHARRDLRPLWKLAINSVAVNSVLTHFCVLGLGLR